MPETATPEAPAAPAAPPAEAPPASEAAPAETAPPAPEAKPEPKSRIFAEEARKEAEYRKKELALKREKEALEQERSSMRQATELAQLARTDPLAYLKQVGFTPDQIAQRLVDDGKPPDALSEARKAREELEAYKKQQAQREQQNQDNAIRARLRQFAQETTEFVAGNEERWEYIARSGAAGQVAQRIKAHWDEFGKVLDVEAAADQLEAEIEERHEAISKAKKWAAKHAAKPAEDAKSPKNLTNSATPAAGSKAPDDRKLTDEERVERAVKKLKEMQEKKD